MVSYVMLSKCEPGLTIVISCIQDRAERFQKLIYLHLFSIKLSIEHSTTCDSRTH